MDKEGSVLTKNQLMKHGIDATIWWTTASPKNVHQRKRTLCSDENFKWQEL